MIRAEAPGPAVRFEHVSVRRGQKQILEDVCAEVPRGGSTVLVGPNGAGKTTLLLCLIGESTHTGSICRFTRGKTGAAPRLGYVPQQLYMDHSLPLLVSEFLALGRRRSPLWLGLRRNERARNRGLLELVRAGHLADRRVGDLSGGELRRVLLAAALAREPDLLVLDEPAAGVDVHGERLLWEVLDAARREQGFTQLMVSHNLPLAAHYATHVICLDKRVLAQGPPRSTLTSAALLQLFGVPIHLYPDQCGVGDPPCPQCGALGGADHVAQNSLQQAAPCLGCAAFAAPGPAKAATGARPSATAAADGSQPDLAPRGKAHV